MSDDIRGQILKNVPLSDFTTWRVGGNARQVYKPTDLNDLSLFLSTLPDDEDILWLGLGSNSLIRDSGFNGTVIITQGALTTLTLENDTTVYVEAGVSCAQMARFCARNNLKDAEFWAGIPGTMGGALRMNAGCYNGETWNFVQEVKTINRQGVINTRDKSSFDIAYRHVIGLNNQEWFVSAKCQFEIGEKELALSTIKSLLARRAETQPTSEYNCGSVFRNPEGDYAARLIESCGLKGFRLGGAEVSIKHANFIINSHGQAKASDIESLINHVHDTVLKNTGYDLVREVHILGE